MKRNDTGSFCVLYIEPTDDKAALMQVINEQKKPIVILLAEQTEVFQRPEDFTMLKHVKRQMNVSIVFVIPNGGHLAQLASRNGFPVYFSMDALADALTVGQLGRHRTITRPTGPLEGRLADPQFVASRNREAGDRLLSPKKTIPLTMTIDDHLPLSPKKTHALNEEGSSPSLKMEEHAVSPKKTTPLVTPTGGTPKKTEPLQKTPMEDIAFKKTSSLPSSPPILPRPRSTASKRSHFLPKALAVLAIFALAIAGLGSFLLFYQKLPDIPPPSAAAPVQIAGRVAFLSSGQLSENSSQGIDDEILLNLNNIPAPTAQKSYYAWLLGDKSQGELRAILLGPLQINKGTARLLYSGDQRHTNLLLANSRILVTEEDATVPPIAPSPDYTTWRYYGEISQVPINAPDNVNRFSYLDHLRHLLASDPTLDELELPGGLNNWLYRNTSKVLEWMTSMREPWEDSKDTGFVRRQTTRTLDYLDGVSYVQQDLPRNTPLLVNERLARIGLVEVNGPAQDPPGYLSHVVRHLSGLLEAPGATPAFRKIVAGVVMALNNTKYWLTQLRLDAQKVMKMSDTQLRQASTLNLLNDMIDNATHAYSGEIDLSTGQMREGISWIHDNMQLLTSINILPYKVGSQSIE